MKLDRNTDPEGRGKYAVVMLRAVDAMPDTDRAPIAEAIETLWQAGVLTYGIAGSPDEFFVLMLKDVHSRPALLSYADSVGRIRPIDHSYSADVGLLAERSGYRSPFCKIPD